MTAQTDPYVRVYYRIIDDPKFESVYDDDRTLATWLRLLLAADAMYPAPAHIPHGVKRAALDKLVKAELVDLLPGHRYRMHGLRAEREGRSEKAAKAARERWEREQARTANALPEQSDSTANASDVGMHSEPLRSTPLQSAPRNSETPARKAGFEGIASIIPDAVSLNGDVPPEVTRLQALAEELTGQPYVMANVYGGLGGKAVTEQLERHGFDRTERAWRQLANRAKAEGKSKPTLRQLVLGADDILNPIEQHDPKEERAEEAAADFDRRVERTRAYIADLRRTAG